MIAIEFGASGTGLTAADRDLAFEICNHVDTELHVLLPTLIDVVHLRIDTGPRVIPEVGYNASAMTPGRISFTLDSNHAGGSSDTLNTYLRPALFHECHHLVRGWVKYGGKPRRHFIEGVICEGLASAFERDAASRALPWSDYPGNVRDWVNELLRLPANAPYSEWMFRHPDGRRWIGYRAGTFIADCAIEESGRSAAELAETGYAKILKLAKLPLPTGINRHW